MKLTFLLNSDQAKEAGGFLQILMTKPRVLVDGKEQVFDLAITPTSDKTYWDGIELTLQEKKDS